MLSKTIRLIVIILVILGLGILFFGSKLPFFKSEENKTVTLDDVVLELGTSSISKYYIYGTKLNMYGNIEVTNTDISNVKLMLYGNSSKDIPIKYEVVDNKINYRISDEINNGYYLDNIEIGKYFFLLVVIHSDNTFENYKVINDTEYLKTDYYTMSKYGNKHVISNDDKTDSMMLNVTKNRDKNIYDIVIDAGHGGNDPGALANGNVEKNLNLTNSLALKKALEGAGFKVKLTRETDVNTPKYGDGGRVTIPLDLKAKYFFSLHMDSNPSLNPNGIEIWSPTSANYDFAKKIADNIVNYTGINYSTNKGFKMFNGVYVRTFSNMDVNDTNNDAIKGGYDPYPNVDTNTNYYFVIRETGGIITGAYVDGRNTKEKANLYLKSNVGVESYMLELGFIGYQFDVDNINNNRDKYMHAITDALIEYNNWNVEEEKEKE